MSFNTQGSMTELFGTVVTELSTLFRKEVQLARAEVGEKVGEATGGIVLIAVGGVLLLAALIVLLQAVITFLVYAGVPLAWAQVIVFAVVALVGYSILRTGMTRLKASNFVPNRTAEQLSRDAAVVKEQVR